MRNLRNDELCVYVIFMFELSAALFAICCGGFLFSQVTSGCIGFRFLGITLILTGVAFVIILYIARDFKRLDDYGNEGLKFFFFSTPLLLVLLALGIFALVVSSKGGGELMPGRSHKVYHVESYSKWMQNKVNQNWDNYYKKAVVENKDIVCNKFPGQFGLDPALKFGCCDPPEECNFNHTNPEIYMVKSDNNSSYYNDDCKRWDNDQNTLCFDCQSCKAGFLQDLTRRWFLIGLVLVVVVSAKLMLGIPFICLIFSNIREEIAEDKRLLRECHGHGSAAHWSPLAHLGCEEKG